MFIVMYCRTLGVPQRKKKMQRSETMQTLGGKSSSKPLIFVLPKEDGEAELYRVDPAKMHLVHELAQQIIVPQSATQSSQSLPMSSMSSLTSDMRTDSGMLFENERT